MRLMFRHEARFGRICDTTILLGTVPDVRSMFKAMLTCYWSPKLANATRMKTWSWWSMVQAGTRARLSLWWTTYSCIFCRYIHLNSIHKGTSGVSYVRSISTTKPLTVWTLWMSSSSQDCSTLKARNTLVLNR